MFDLLDYSLQNPKSKIQNLKSVAVVGAGGKTTLCWRLVQAAVARGQRVIFTTTTKIWQPAPQAFDVILLAPDLTQALLQLQGRADWHSACVVAGAESAAPEIGVMQEARFLRPKLAHMPVLPRKMVGYTPDEVCAAVVHLPFNCQLVIEADGARGALFKAPAAHEPMIPVCADVVYVVANRDIIGLPLDGQMVHRPEIVGRLAGLALGELMTPQAFMCVLSHSQGGLKNVPPNASRVLVLNGQPCDVPIADGVFDDVMMVVERA